MAQYSIRIRNSFPDGKVKTTASNISKAKYNTRREISSSIIIIVKGSLRIIILWLVGLIKSQSPHHVIVEIEFSIYDKIAI